MSPLFERLRAALWPDYALLRELASGGMGTVYLARDVALDCPVAVKVIRPELATARAVERFVREARTLASLSHPNIVPVHKVGERNGLHFYVMDYLRGETLQQRLETHGRLTHHQALKLGRDLLEALEVAHSNSVIHRDVKPANLFLVGRRAVLTDFGIAKQIGKDGDTDPGLALGTLAYMAPELLVGAEANERSDLYAAGMVVYEAFTGLRWDKRPPEEGRWPGVPHGVAPVLRRALELDPKDRWPDAAAFRRPLWRTRVWPYRRNVIGVALGCTLSGVALASAVLGSARLTTLRLSLEVSGAAPGLPPWLGDSVACGLARRLDAYPELSAHCTSGLLRLVRRGVRVRPEIENDRGQARVLLASSVEELRGIEARGSAEQWPTLADSLADRVFRALLRTGKLLDASLPLVVLPKTLEGRLAFQRAERAFAEGRWGEARAFYSVADALDPTCWLCYWRHAEVGRWFNLQDDPADGARYRAHQADFPEYYRSLIGAEQLPEGARLDSLRVLNRRWKDFLFGQFRRGDELLHRGPLVGHPRREAVAPLEAALKLQPRFAPGLQHLAWVHIAEGDSARAAVTLARAERVGEARDPSFATLALLELAHAWRFFPRPAAERATDDLVRRARADSITEFDAGARYLQGFGSPEGELAVAERLLGQPRFARSAGIARVLALTGLGRPEAALALARGLARDFPDLGLFVDELAATTILFDVDSARFVREWPAVAAALAADTLERRTRADRRGRAAWALALAERGASERGDSSSGEPPPLHGTSPALTALLEATRLAQRGHYALALAASDSLRELPAQGTDDPFFRAALHLLRARWYERAAQPANAEAELLWHENSDLLGYPTGDPQPAEVDWALAPLAQWRRGTLLERAGGRASEGCRAYRAVARLWAGGEPRYRARADSAVQRIEALGCRGNP